MPTIKTGRPAPTTTLHPLDGDGVNLAQTWAGQPAWLIFLRHLA